MSDMTRRAMSDGQEYGALLVAHEALKARLAACERVVEAARAVVLDAREQHGYDQYCVVISLIDALRAAVAAETCARSAPITADDTQGET